MRHALVIATVDRHDILTKLLYALRDMETPPCEVVISAPTEAGIPAAVHEDFPFAVTPVTGARGSSAQRNFGVKKLTQPCDTVSFLDDDSVPRSDFFEAVERHFTEYPGSSAVTGRVVLEGSEGRPPLTEDDIHSALSDSFEKDKSGVGPVVEHDALYGCNMIFRREIFDNFQFDERLRLYGWLEDVDLARAIIKAGHKVYKDPRIVIVHRKDPSGGRTSHVRFGYSTVANWEHLRRKGHVQWSEFPGSVVYVMGKNALRAVKGPDKELRRMRLKGNLMAVADIARGRVTPERIEKIGN